jgi:purine catabolism regulator
LVDCGASLTLDDLLAERSFELELLSGCPDLQRRRVLGGHAVEVEHPTRWLAEGWVMLTTGIRLRGHASAQAALVEELQDAAVAALGFGVGLVFKQVPRALLQTAHERSFPVFAVPYATNFRDIIRFIDNSLASADAQLLHRISALQRYLVDALATPEPERTVIERLGRFLDASVVVVDEHGRVEAAVGDAPVDEVRAAVAHQPLALIELDAGGCHVVATPVAAPDRAAHRWLILASRHPSFVNKLIKPAATATAPLLAATARLRDAVRDQERAVRAALLTEVLEPPDAEDLLPLKARVASFGLDFSQPARVALIREHPRRQDPRRPTDLESLARQLGDRLERLATGCLITTRSRSVTALAQADPEDLGAALHDLTRAHPSAVGGIGRPVMSLTDVHHSLRDAELATRRAALVPEQRVLLFEDFDFGTFVISEIARDRLRPWVDDLADLLREHPPLHEAVIAYFEHDLDVIDAAAALHLHSNSLRYRLRRVEELLGGSLKQPSTITTLYLALVAEAAGEPWRGDP